MLEVREGEGQTRREVARNKAWKRDWKRQDVGNEGGEERARSGGKE